MIPLTEFDWNYRMTASVSVVDRGRRKLTRTRRTDSSTDSVVQPLFSSYQTNKPTGRNCSQSKNMSSGIVLLLLSVLLLSSTHSLHLTAASNRNFNRIPLYYERSPRHNGVCTLQAIATVPLSSFRFNPSHEYHHEQKLGISGSTNSGAGGFLRFIVPIGVGSKEEKVEQQFPVAIQDDLYRRRKEKWAGKYCSVDALRERFGSNKNKVWGDLDAYSARRLYKTLLPRALLELYTAGVRSEDLAPLAYQARLAAKLYARERCELPCRLAANVYDGFRQWKKYGSFDCSGMSYEQVWEKYSDMVLQEYVADENNTDEASFLEQRQEEVTAKICLKILEKSCTTNPLVDSLVLGQKGKDHKWERQELIQISKQLENDVRRLLQPLDENSHLLRQAQRFGMLRRLVRLKRRLESIHLTPPTLAHHDEHEHEPVPVLSKNPKHQDQIYHKDVQWFVGTRHP